ncbi:MAG: hypothetical protein QN148_07860 [Armatimonadota bacterium]|nr:hypothetical protein [Armatimonadota bacterium]MDR7462882.1 hypothetical protein [Armatimonadota bacterium]MDR7515008.1 hypothetical protein [Armatimonadota bacterium]MDR7561921.1 hypothetical protein [Armatimonadota bacterium]MDR7565848.1 hypothetical protein [Armatimonadota bacterium]
MSWTRRFLVVGVLASLWVGAAGRWPARAEVWQPVQLTVRDRGEGRVTVTATWQGVREGSLVLRVAFDTHSVDLSGFDVASNTVLRDEAGRELRPLRWQEEQSSSHHRSGLLVFAAPPAPPGRLLLVVRNLAGVPERVLVFEFRQ